MYSDLKNVQILIALLKKYNIRKLVLASGMTSVPIIHSVEKDSFFECFSVVDERSAAYFAMGLSQEKHEPVGLVCTSGTAACNFYPAITEAYYQNVPLIVMTCDKRPYDLEQHILQKIQQSGMYMDKCRYSADIPFVINEETERYCIRSINEAFIKAFVKGKGPVHLNVFTGGNRKFSVEELPAVRKIDYYKSRSLFEMRKEKEMLVNAKSILVVAGQNGMYSEEDCETINRFEKKYNCAFVMDHMGNLDGERILKPFRVLESMSVDFFEENLCPDLVISFGGNIVSGKLHEFLLKVNGKFSHWHIDENGTLVDTWGALEKVFECSAAEFFEQFLDSDTCNDDGYYGKWAALLKETEHPHFPFTHMYLAEKMAELIPEASIVHLAILNSTRVAQFYEFKKDVTVYSNIGALGIDGSMSSFLGQACETDKKCFLLIGDLSFFYDMNSLCVRYLGGNVNIILINNGGGGEFYFNIGKRAIPCIDNYIAASHTTVAKAWVEERGFKYYSAHTCEEFDLAIREMVESDDNVPKFVEAFTNKDIEADTIRDFYVKTAHKTARNIQNEAIKNSMKSILGESVTNKIISKVKK